MERATTTLGWACVITQRRRKSGRTTPRPSTLFDANATYVMAGLRFRRIQRFGDSQLRGREPLGMSHLICCRIPVMLSSRVRDRKTRNGIPKRMAVSRYMVRVILFLASLSSVEFLIRVRLVDTDGNAGPADPLAALEKSTTAQDHVNKVQIPRLESLQGVSDRYNSDPYALSSLVRKRFRAEKKLDAAKRAADDQLKGRYGLPETLQLAAEDDESKNAAREQWEGARREHEARTSIRRVRLQSSAIPSSLSSTGSSQGRDPLALLKARVLSNTRQSRTLKPPDGLK